MEVDLYGELLLLERAVEPPCLEARLYAELAARPKPVEPIDDPPAGAPHDRVVQPFPPDRLLELLVLVWRKGRQQVFDTVLARRADPPPFLPLSLIHI